MDELRDECATLNVPTYPSLPDHNTQSGSARTNGSADAPWLVGYRHDRINSTVLLLGFKPPVTELLRPHRWSVLIPGEGWAFPTRYLAHVERLLDGANVLLFDIGGDPTPGQRERQRAEEREQSRALFDEIRAARDAHDPTRAHRAYVAASEQLQAKLAELASSRSEGATG